MESKYPFAYTSDHKKINIDDAKTGEKYTCIFCGNNMIAKTRGKHRIPHFAHKEKCSETWTYDMSDWHKKWQHFFSGNTEVIMEIDGKTHIADVAIDDVVIEFQHSPISIDEFRDRNNFYTSLNYKVIWLFDLSDLFSKGQISRPDTNEMLYKWLYTKTPFKKMDLPKEKAQIFFQLKDSDDIDCGEIVYPIKQLDNFKHFFTDNKSVLSISEFIDYINKNHKTNIINLVNEYFLSEEKDNYPIVMDSISTKYIPYHNEPQYISDLWDPRFHSMMIENINNGNVFKVYSGNSKNGILQKKQNNGYYKGYGSFIQIYDYYKPVWKRIAYYLITNKEVLESKANIDYLEHLHGNDNLYWSNISITGDSVQAESGDLLTLLNSNYPKQLILKLDDNDFYVLFKNTFHTTYFEDEVFRYYSAYYYDFEKREYLGGFPINYYLRKNHLSSKWIKIVYPEHDKKIKELSEKKPEYVEYVVKEPVYFAKSKGIYDITSKQTSFVAKNEENEEICYFDKIQSSFNVYKYDVKNKRYNKNELLNYFVFGEWIDHKWQEYKHYEPGSELKDDILEIQNSIIHKQEYPHKDGKKLFYISQLRETYNEDTMILKCSMNDYLYSISYSYRRGSGNGVPMVEIFNSETGERLTGSVEAFNFKMLDLPIWYIYENSDDKEE